MQLEWDGKIGPASIVGIVGSLSVLVTLGIVWGKTTTKLEAVETRAIEAHTTITEVAKEASKRDQRVAAQAERLGKIETSIQFVVPALQRIEAKLDAPKL